MTNSSPITIYILSYNIASILSNDLLAPKQNIRFKDHRSKTKIVLDSIQNSLELHTILFVAIAHSVSQRFHVICLPEEFDSY